MATTTKYWTLQEITLKIQRDLDIEGETFIQDTELTEYINEAIDECEAEIHSMYEDYFLDNAPLTFVSGQDEYSLPDEIYAHKVRRITYRNGSKVYTLHRVRDWFKFERYELERVTEAATEYVYFIINQTPGAPKILLSPPAKEDGAFARIWFLRQANRLSDVSDVCDIPEFINFIFQYVKVRVYEKEGHPMLMKAMADLDRQRSLMVGTLASMVPDADNEIEPDLSHYEEMV